jgi:hypothetical protein
MTHCEKCIHHDICKIDANLMPEDFVNFFPHNEGCTQFKEKAEIESLQDRIDTLNDTNKRIMESQEAYWKSKLEEFVERAKDNIWAIKGRETLLGEEIKHWQVVEAIDKLKKEMVGEQ